MFIQLKDKFRWLNSFFSLFSIDISSTPNKFVSWQYLCLGLLLFFACFYGLSGYALLDMNEGLYAEIAREMLAGKHFIIPTLNNVPYLEKPPLLYWLIAASYQLFGVNAFAARIIPALFLALTGLGVVYVGHREEKHRVGFITAVILLSSIIYIMIGRTVFFDMVLNFFNSASLVFFYYWTKDKKTSDLNLFYSFLALAILTKGFVSMVLIGLVAGIYMIMTRADKNDYKLLFNKQSLIIFLAITLPWHLLALVTFPPFFWEYFINNQLLRFFNTRVPHDFHTGPLYFYIPRLIAYLLPWTIFLPALCWPVSFKNFKQPWTNPLNIFLSIWFVVMFVFFSLSGDKGDYYLVIGVLPIAWLLGEKIEAWVEQNKTKALSLGFFVSVGVLIVLSVFAYLFYTSHGVNDPAEISGVKIPHVLKDSVMFLGMGSSAYAVLGFYLLQRSDRNKAMLAFLLLAGLIIPLELFYLNFRENTEFKYSQVNLAKYIQSQYQHRVVYFYKDYETLSSFVFYNKEPAVIIDSTSSDLYFGQHAKGTQKYFITLQEFQSQADKGPVYVVLRKEKLRLFLSAMGDKYKTAFCVVQSSGSVDLLTNSNEDCRANLDIAIQGQEKQGSLLEFKK